MKTCRWIKGLAFISAWLACSAMAAADPVRIFAAASLQGPLDRAAALWPDDTIVNYGGSGTMARQLSLGAPADIAILANALWADWLVTQGGAETTPVDLLSNQLVLIGPAGADPFEPTPDALLARLEGGRLAMGLRDAVPAGIYASAWLRHIAAWDSLAPHLAEVENVRAALALVTRGEAPLGVVYASDAVAAAGAVSVLYAIPLNTHPPIRYPALALTDAGRAFLEHLQGNAQIFYDAGFAPP